MIVLAKTDFSGLSNNYLLPNGKENLSDLDVWSVPSTNKSPQLGGGSVDLDEPGKARQSTSSYWQNNMRELSMINPNTPQLEGKHFANVFKNGYFPHSQRNQALF